MNKRIYFLVVMSLLMTSGYAQDEVVDKEIVTFGLNAGFGQNTNAFCTANSNTDYSYYGIRATSSIGADLGIAVSQRLRPRVELKYVQFAYGMKWNNNSDFDKTERTLYNLDLNVYLDYRLFTIKKLKLFISPGIVNEFLVQNQLKTTFTDGDTNYKRYNSIDEEYPDNRSGANLSLLAKYNVTKWLGVTLNTGYTRFFNNFCSDSNEAYHRIGVSAGVEIKLF